jgi:hypothetical protein
MAGDRLAKSLPTYGRGTVAVYTPSHLRSARTRASAQTRICLSDCLLATLEVNLDSVDDHLYTIAFAGPSNRNPIFDGATGLPSRRKVPSALLSRSAAFANRSPA